MFHLKLYIRKQNQVNKNIGIFSGSSSLGSENVKIENCHIVKWTDADYWTRLNHAIGMGYQIKQNIILTGDLNSDLFISHNNNIGPSKKILMHYDHLYQMGLSKHPKKNNV
jgi:hypothetical protein